MHQTPTDPTPSSVSFTLTPPSHHPFSDAEYNSTHSGTTSNPSHSPTFSPLHQENSYDHQNQKLTSKNHVKNPPSPWEEQGKYDQPSPPSTFSNNPYLLSPQHIISRASTPSTHYKTTPPNKGAEDGHDIILLPADKESKIWNEGVN